MKRDPLLWLALVAVLVVLASAEYELAVACGFGTYVAAGVPAALDIYAVAALRARRDVPVAVAVLIAVNAASHLVEVGLLPVNVTLVVAVSAIAPLVLWRVHRLGEHHQGPVLDVSSAPAEPVAELAGGTGGTQGGTGSDLLPDHFTDAHKVIGGTPAEPAPEPVPPPVPPTGTGAADIVSEDSQNTTFEARVALVRTWLVTEPELTGTETGTRLGVSDGYGRRVLRNARGDS